MAKTRENINLHIQNQNASWKVIITYSNAQSFFATVLTCRTLYRYSKEVSIITPSKLQSELNTYSLIKLQNFKDRKVAEIEGEKKQLKNLGNKCLQVYGNIAAVSRAVTASATAYFVLNDFGFNVPYWKTITFIASISVGVAEFQLHRLSVAATARASASALDSLGMFADILHRFNNKKSSDTQKEIERLGARIKMGCILG